LWYVEYPPPPAGGGAHARQFLVVTQSLFFFCLVICLLINHGEVAQNDGISFYGVYGPTILILIAGFSVAALGLWRTATYLSRSGAPTFSVLGLRVVAVGLFVLLATPYNQGTFFNWAHMCTGVTISLIQLAVAGLLVARRPSARAVGGFVLLMIGGVIAAASLPDWHFIFLLQGETMLEVGFAMSLVEWTYLAVGGSPSAPSR
jgi:hypothetical protein